jgi:hypothetical protein
MEVGGKAAGEKKNKMEKKKRRQKGNYVSITVKLSPKCLKLIEKTLLRQNMQSMSAIIEATVRPWMGQYTTLRRPYGKYKLIKKTFTFNEDFVSGIIGCGNMSLYIEQELIKKIK